MVSDPPHWVLCGILPGLGCSLTQSALSLVVLAHYFFRLILEELDIHKRLQIGGTQRPNVSSAGFPTGSLSHSSAPSQNQRFGLGTVHGAHSDDSGFTHTRVRARACV